MARSLPRWMHEKHGAYYLVRRNKWHRLAGNLHDALVEYARLTSGSAQGALGELVGRSRYAEKTLSTFARFIV